MRSVFLALAVAVSALAAESPVVQEFLSWYKDYRGSFQPPEVLKAYTAKLSNEGLTKPEIDQRTAAILGAIRAMPAEFAALHFDHIYMAEKAPFRTEPSRFVVRAVDGVKPGRALDVAMGQGRNALYLAKQGWDVTGYDISEEGLAMARSAAAKANLSLKAIRATHDEFDYGTAQWDLIVETFAFTNLSDPAYCRRLVTALKPRGLLVIEGFGNPTNQGPRNVLIEAFKDQRVVIYEDLDEVSDWGLQKMRLSRIVVEKN